MDVSILIFTTMPDCAQAMDEMPMSHSISISRQDIILLLIGQCIDMIRVQIICFLIMK